MRQLMRRLAAAGLALVMTAGQGALASVALGHDLVRGSIGVSPATELNKQIFWSDTYSDLRTEHYVTYTPNASVSPVVAYGDKVLTRATLTSMAQSLEAQGRRVVGGINADYYVLATGAPLGLVLTDGIVRSAASLSSSYRYGVGFLPDGSAFIGKPVISVTATFLGQSLPVGGGINRIRTEKDGYVLLNSDFHATTQNTSPGVDVILTPVLDNIGEPVDINLQVQDPGGVEGGMPDWLAGGTEDADANKSGQAPGGEEIDPEGQDEEGQGTPPDGEAQDSEPSEAEGIEEETSRAAGGEFQGPQGENRDAGANGGRQDADDSQAYGARNGGTEIQARQVRSGDLTIGGRVTCTVEQVLESTGSIAIPEGKLVLSVNAQADQALVERLRALSPGDTVDIDITSNDGRWAEAKQAVGAMYKLISGGVVQQPEDATASKAWAERTARTALGIRADGSVIFYTIDGKQPGYSIGATLTQVATRLQELGCVEAVSLDGGGSTTLGATLPDASAVAVQGRPSDGKQRANSTAIFLTTDLKPTGVLDHFYLAPGQALLLSGASIQMSAVAVDTSYYKMDYAGPLSYSIQNGDGIVSTEGLFTAGGTSGETQVTATTGTAWGSTTISVIKEPDQITVANEATGTSITALAVDPGQQVDLKASAKYRGLAVVSQDTCYTWSADPAIGTVDANGIFNASDKSGSGAITVSAGGRSVSIPVSVAGHVLTLETFEGGVNTLTGSDSATVSGETGQEYVRFGRQSARVAYDAATGAASVGAALTIPTGESYLGMWIYGDGSGNTLIATAVDQAGLASDLVVSALDFTGWKHVMIELPQGTTALSAFQVVFGGQDGKQTGTIWLDQLTTANEAMLDEMAPTITLTVSGNNVSATVSDNMDRNIPADRVTLTYDGTALAANWDEGSNTLSAALPLADGQAHRVTVTAEDASGNLGRASADIAPDDSNPSAFVDMQGHWAAPYAEFLYSKGITNGIGEADALSFVPDKNITRGEFFALVARWMKLDLTQYAGVELPFADAAQIPEWFQSEVKAMYSLGILKGSSGGNGALLVNANASISRAEAMTILGRTQARGYTEEALTFSDASSVPAWSLQYVCSLVGQGVVGGYENRISPNAFITRGEVAKMLYAML